MKKLWTTCLVLTLLTAPARADALLEQLISGTEAEWGPKLQSSKSQLTDVWLDAGVQEMLSSLAQGNPLRSKQISEVLDAANAARTGQAAHDRGRAQILLASMLAQGASRTTLNSLGREILSDPTSATYSGHLMKGLEAFVQHKPGLAQNELVLGEQQYPRSAAIHTTLAYLYLQTQQSDKAKTEFEAVIKIEPNNQIARDALTSLAGNAPGLKGAANAAALDHFNKAEQLFQAQKFAEAQAEYRAAIAADPKFSTAWVYLGDSYFSTGDKDKAIDCYHKAINVDASNFQAYRFLGDVLVRRYEETGKKADLNEAISAFESALRINPNYAQAKSDLEEARRRAGR